jgi:hypothetical protein
MPALFNNGFAASRLGSRCRGIFMGFRSFAAKRVVLLKAQAAATAATQP